MKQHAKLQATSCSSTFNLTLFIGIKEEGVAEVAAPSPSAQRITRLQGLQLQDRIPASLIIISSFSSTESPPNNSSAVPSVPLSRRPSDITVGPTNNSSAGPSVPSSGFYCYMTEKCESVVCVILWQENKHYHREKDRERDQERLRNSHTGW